jgi:hypothetical protein
VLDVQRDEVHGSTTAFNPVEGVQRAPTRRSLTKELVRVAEGIPSGIE